MAALPLPQRVAPMSKRIVEAILCFLV